MSNPQPDHADDPVRINSYTTVRRRSSVPHEDFAAYWLDVHGPLCSRLPGLGWYVQHHFAREQDAHLWPVVADLAPLPGYVLDGAVEIGFSSAPEQRTFQEASPVLFGDEQNVFDETLAYDLPDGSSTLRGTGTTRSGPDGADRLHVHLGARPGAGDDLRAAVRGDLLPALSDAEDLLTLRLHEPAPRDADADEPPAPDVAHHAVAQRQELVVLELGFTDRISRRRALAASGVQHALSTVAGAAAHATAFPVSGVHVFVRDGRLTTAGLRGGRAAELITRLAAVNQLSDEVVHLFQP